MDPEPPTPDSHHHRSKTFTDRIGLICLRIGAVIYLFCNKVEIGILEFVESLDYVFYKFGSAIATYVDEVQGTGIIPRVLHFMKHDSPGDQHLFNSWMESCRRANPGWGVRVWTPEQNRKLVELKYPWLLPTYDGLYDNVTKNDLSILLYLHQYGGAYISPDTECIRGFDEGYIQPDNQVILIKKNEMYPNKVLLSRQGHPIWLWHINEIQFNMDHDPNANVEDKTGWRLFKLTATAFKKFGVAGPTRVDGVHIRNGDNIYPLDWTKIKDFPACDSKSSTYDPKEYSTESFAKYLRSESSDSSAKCSQSFIIDEPKYELFPPGDNWASAYLHKRKEEFESGEATLSCDLSLLETPLHFVTVSAGGDEGKYKAMMRKTATPFESWLHPLFDRALSSVARLTKRTEKDKMLIIDAGGNYLAKRKHEVHTFEPFIKNMRLLRCSAQINKLTNLFLHRVALSNITAATRVCLNVPEGNVGGTTLSEECGKFSHKEAKNYDTSTDIRTIKLDDFWKVVLKRRRPIDVEGYEVKAFLGASEFLTSAPPYYIFSEIFNSKIRDTGFDPLEYVNILEKAGYKTYTSSSLSPYVHDPENDGGADVVFVHKDILGGQGDVFPA
ncbi:hypothetical protein HDU76_001490 [Blyttiomyces sp. JEL0837]|nr:hypothetical protein HDU76_001490 [Blyttiomyces sp. JEL0837]